MLQLIMFPAKNERLRNATSGSAKEVFLAFLKLGLISFGGPIAHLGYFRTEFVEHRRWVSEQQFGQLLAVCQFLPGPASSQLGFSLGLLRAGPLGALAAFIAFTLPSVVLLVAFASALPLLTGAVGVAAVHGLKIVACAVVAHAVLGMFRKLCPDAISKGVAILSAAALIILSSALAQLAIVAIAAVIGALFFRDVSAAHSHARLGISYGPGTGYVLFAVFAALLFGLPLFATGKPDYTSVADAFYRAGALVFGGGHVVLPLLEDSVVSSGWVTSEEFLAGYGVAQAIPGPMFAFAAYLGAVLSPSDNVFAMVAIASASIFLPGFLLISGILPFWGVISRNPAADRVIAGINAAVVGLLAAALYDPVLTTGISGLVDMVIALVAFAMLSVWRLSALIVVIWCVAARMLPQFLIA